MSDILKKEATTIRKVEIKSRNIDPSSDEESKSDRKRKRKKVCSIKRHFLPEVITSAIFWRSFDVARWVSKVESRMGQLP